jgi:hypothetical protein
MCVVTMESLDDEWTQFLLSQSVGFRLSKCDDHTGHSPVVKPLRLDTVEEEELNEPEDDTETEDMSGGINHVSIKMGGGENQKPRSRIRPTVGKADENMELIISTKTKVLFLNQAMDIHTIFWDIPVQPYWMPKEGVLKKQIKIVSKTPEEFAVYQEKLKGITYYQENIIKQIHNPGARTIKFKDERKLTVGISKKDITAYRGKSKNAFYNCFALVIRFLDTIDNVFREIHVKVFNTGKMEIPGLVNPRILENVKSLILGILVSSIRDEEVRNTLKFVENSHEDHVLVNSNFNCGFFVNRDKFHAILNSDKYGIESSYDPCSYPGVKCKFYFNHEYGFDVERQRGRVCEEDRGMKLSELIDNKKYTEVSFMIFRTGSGLIVGNCTELVLRFVFDFIKKILMDEYKNIAILSENPVIKNKKPKLRRRVLSYTDEYYRGEIGGAEGASNEG